MSHRDRPSTVAMATSPAPADSAVRSPVERNGDPPGLSWEELYLALPSHQQHELLVLAARQGFLNARQVPTPSSPDRARQFLTSILAGSPSESLPLPQPEPVELVDTALDASQREALSRALHTPDLCLIQGVAGTGKSRLIAELCRQAARRGQRVLLTAPGAAAVDVVLKRLTGDTSVIALRGLARDESATELDPVIAARTFATLRRQLVEESASNARGLHEEAATRRARVQSDRDRLDPIEHHSAALATLAAQRQALEQEPILSEEFTRQLDLNQAQHDAELRRLDEQSSSAAAELQQIHQRLGELETQLSEKQHAEAERGWLSKLLPFGSNRQAAQVQEWKKEADELRTSQDRVKRQIEELAGERHRLVSDWQATRQRRLDEETERCRTERDRLLAELNAEINGHETALQQLTSELSPEIAAVASESITLARERAARAIEQAEADEQFTSRWVEYLDAHASELPARILRCVNLFAAPLGALATDETLSELMQAGPFDLMILDEAHLVTEPDLLAAARRAQRWVLVGEPGENNGDSGPERWERRPRDRGRGGATTLARLSARALKRALPWPRLWQQLHAEPWRLEAERLHARLEPLTAAQAEQLEIEPLADSPDIELGIWSKPGSGTSSLAEMSFPAHVDRATALTSIYRELNELPVPVAAHCWTESAESIRCQLLDSECIAAVPLEAGLVAHLCEAGRIAAIEFDRGSNWDLPRAETWANQTLRVNDLGRTAQLTTQHRLGDGPAALAAALGFDIPARPVTGWAAEFVPVPALTEPQARRRGDVGLNGQQRRLPHMRGGAGLDLDVADPRQRERVPAEYRSELPARGFVNVPEAHGIIRLLETLVDDLPADRPESIAVLPMYEAQAALLRQLVAQSTVLRACPVALQILTAGAARQIEADWVIIGLTRSHGHRAVSYGDGPPDLAQALTRARRRLILVGDPGTLARRSHWEGPLDHLDAETARRERDWVAALVHLLQGQGPPAVQLREGPP